MQSPVPIYIGRLRLAIVCCVSHHPVGLLLDIPKVLDPTVDLSISQMFITFRVPQWTPQNGGVKNSSFSVVKAIHSLLLLVNSDVRIDVVDGMNVHRCICVGG